VFVSDGELALLVNGEPRAVPPGCTVEGLVRTLGLDRRRIAVAVNRHVVPRYQLGSHGFTSRLIIGSGKYASFEQNRACAEASGAEMVTVALRRTKLDAPKGQGLLDFISPDRFTILPNTAGCFTAEDALTTARLGRELLGTDLVKLEVIGDERTLFPDVAATIEAARVLLDEGFTVLPYVTDDPVACQRLAALGPSCRWARRSARAWASATRRTSGSSSRRWRCP
jgi:thiazole synthase